MLKKLNGLAGFASMATMLCLIASPGAALAVQGQPENWQLGFQDAVTPIARQINDFHNLLLVITFAIVIFVLALLVTVIIRFNAKANPNPSRTSHNTLIEVAWTVVPILILLVIAFPSWRLLKAQLTYPPADLVIKAIGHQWYWEYEYPDSKVSFESYMLEDEDIEKARSEGRDLPRLLAVDNQIVVPANKIVHVLVTAQDVIHNWTIPAFGSKIDAVPGRISRTWFKAEKVGTYYGQCSELCGIRHAFMPIAVKVVAEPVFKKWLSAMADGPEKANEVLRRADLDLQNSELRLARRK